MVEKHPQQRTHDDWGSVDRHLSVFLPYDRPPNHEDQLTRAAMIVMRAIPLARDALLARIDALPAATLPEPELDMQARDVLKVPALSEAQGVSLNQLGHRGRDRGRVPADLVAGCPLTW